MSKKLSLVCLVVLLALVSNASASLVEHWGFDDAVGSTIAVGDNGNNGVVSGATFTGAGGGYGGVGGAVKFGGGLYEWVNPPTSTLASVNGQVTVACWTYGAANNPTSLYGSTLISAYGPGWEVWINVPDVQYGNQIFFNAGGNILSAAAVPADYKGQWTHWAFTADTTAGDMKIYKDGLLFASATGMTKPISGAGVFLMTIGNHPYGNWQYTGLLDDMYIYNNALSQSDIQALSGVPEPTTIALLGLGLFGLLRRKNAK